MNIKTTRKDNDLLRHAEMRLRNNGQMRVQKSLNSLQRFTQSLLASGITG